jgi:hypothetical protein
MESKSMSSDTHNTPRVEALRGTIARLASEENDNLRWKLSRDETASALEASFDHADARAKQVAGIDAARLMTGARGHSALLALQGHHGQRYDDSTLRDVFALICAALGRKALRALYQPALAALPAGLDKDAKAARLAEIATDLDRLEAEEERLICEAAEQGIDVQRRPDARPEIVLALHADSEGGHHD